MKPSSIVSSTSTPDAVGVASGSLLHAAATSVAQSTSPEGMQREWLEADGLGGFASGTVSGARSRRYHALLLTASLPPTGRVVLVNGFEAWLEGPEGVTPLSTQHYAPDVIYPTAWQRITSFESDPWPTWRYCLGWPATLGDSLTHEIFGAGDGGDAHLPRPGRQQRRAAGFEGSAGGEHVIDEQYPPARRDGRAPADQ